MVVNTAPRLSQSINQAQSKPSNHRETSATRQNAQLLLKVLTSQLTVSRVFYILEQLEYLKLSRTTVIRHSTAIDYIWLSNRKLYTLN